MAPKKIVRLFALLLLLTGTAVLLLPSVGQQLYRQRAKEVVKQYDTRLQEMDGERLDELYQAIMAYNENLFVSGQEDLADPFSYEQLSFSLKAFGFEEEMIGYLSIEKMDLLLPIYLGANSENMKRGAAHLTQTSLPVGGKNTNAVIAAHRGMGTAAMFRDIEKLEPGDKVIITNFRQQLIYQVVEVKVITPSSIQEILIQPGRDLVTLLTCHPYGYNYQRYAVYCERVEEEMAALQQDIR